MLGSPGLLSQMSRVGASAIEWYFAFCLGPLSKSWLAHHVSLQNVSVPVAAVELELGSWRRQLSPKVNCWLLPALLGFCSVFLGGSRKLFRFCCVSLPPGPGPPAAPARIFWQGPL